MRLTDELRDVLARAEEIQRSSRRGGLVQAELEAVIGAAEEVGLKRSAVERALRERLDLVPTPTVGSLVFAKLTNGKFYAAEVVSVSDDGVRVRFLRGSEHMVMHDEVWQAPPRKLQVSPSRTRPYATLLGAGAIVGAMIGSIITALIIG